MSNELIEAVGKDVIEKVINSAVAAGADFAEIFIEDKASNSVSLDDNKIDNLSSSSDRGAGIRVISGDTTGFAHTSDLSEASLMAAVKSASEVIETPKNNKSVELVFEPSPKPNIKIQPSQVSKKEKVELLKSANEAARQVGNEITQVNARYSESRRRIIVANSNGVFRDDDQTKTLFSISSVASGDTGLQTGREAIGHTIGYELFEKYDVKLLAQEAAKRAIKKIQAKPAPTGVLPVVIGPGSGGVLFHEACGHGLEADLVYKGASVFANRIGEQVASKNVTLIDDGTMSGEWGTYSIDDEGYQSDSHILIENGILVDYMWDAKTAWKHDREPTGNGRRQSYKHLPMVRMTNTYLAAGEKSPEEIISSVDYGVYVSQLGGGQVDTTSGDFVFGMVEAYLIENGKLTTPLRDGQLIGNGPKVLTQIEEVGNDFAMGPPGTCGKDGQGVPVGDGVPTLLVSELTVGGAA